MIPFTLMVKVMFGAAVDEGANATITLILVSAVATGLPRRVHDKTPPVESNGSPPGELASVVRLIADG